MGSLFSNLKLRLSNFLAVARQWCHIPLIPQHSEHSEGRSRQIRARGPPGLQSKFRKAKATQRNSVSNIQKHLFCIVLFWLFEVGYSCGAWVDLGLGILFLSFPRAFTGVFAPSWLSLFYFTCFVLKKHLTVQPAG